MLSCRRNGFGRLIRRESIGFCGLVRSGCGWLGGMWSYVVLASVVAVCGAGCGFRRFAYIAVRAMLGWLWIIGCRLYAVGIIGW